MTSGCPHASPRPPGRQPPPHAAPREHPAPARAAPAPAGTHPRGAAGAQRVRHQAGVHAVWWTATLWRVHSVCRLVSARKGSGPVPRRRVRSALCTPGRRQLLPAGCSATHPSRGFARRLQQPATAARVSSPPAGGLPARLGQAESSQARLLPPPPPHTHPPTRAPRRPLPPAGTSTTASSCTSQTPAATTAAGRLWPSGAATRQPRTCSRRSTRTSWPWQRWGTHGRRGRGFHG